MVLLPLAIGLSFLPSGDCVRSKHSFPDEVSEVGLWEANSHSMGIGAGLHLESEAYGAPDGVVMYLQVL